jgi:hypothetical protein
MACSGTALLFTLHLTTLGSGLSAIFTMHATYPSHLTSFTATDAQLWSLHILSSTMLLHTISTQSTSVCHLVVRGPDSSVQTDNTAFVWTVILIFCTGYGHRIFKTGCYLTFREFRLFHKSALLLHDPSQTRHNLDVTCNAICWRSKLLVWKWQAQFASIF